MSDENVELLRRWIEAFNAREIDAIIAHCDPSIELHSVFAAAGGAVYSGHDGLRRWQRDLELNVEVVRALLDACERGRPRPRPRTTRAPVALSVSRTRLRSFRAKRPRP